MNKPVKSPLVASPVVLVLQLHHLLKIFYLPLFQTDTSGGDL